MKLTTIIFRIITLFLVSSCSPDSPKSEPPSEVIDSLGLTTAKNPSAAPICEIEGKILEGNKIQVSRLNRLLAIVATKETEDINFGESHRLFVVYDHNSCEEIYRKILPVNRSPDFPYFLSEINYNHLSKTIAIRGYDKFYVFDLENLKLSHGIAPKFLKQRIVEDAQSGKISRLEVWENYLIGYASGMGSFVFDLSDLASVQPVLPVAEIEIEHGTGFQSLFLLNSRDATGLVQALMPGFNETTQEFILSPLFSKPMRLLKKPSRMAGNAPYILFQNAESKNLFVIDLSHSRLIELPREIQLRPESEILQWVRLQPLQ